MTFFVTFAIGSSIQAEEGFFSEKSLPPELLSAWKATFIVYPSDKSKVGTAFVIDKQKTHNPDLVQLSLLTADHVVQGLCGRGLGSCDNMVLSSSVGFDAKTHADIIMDRRGHTIEGVDVVKRSPGRDLALLQVTVNRNQYQDIEPVPLVASCDELYRDDIVYLLGFPNLRKRTNFLSSMERPSELIRRWSWGYPVDHIPPPSKPGDPVSVHQMGTTADALPSSSGSPALNEKGEFWGLASGIRKSKNRSYSGNEGSSPKKYHSRVVECWDVEEFLKN